MSRPAFIALADDLTGAAELAGIGRGMGLRSVICTSGRTPSRTADLTVYDTDSRLCAPAEAALRVRTALAAAPQRRPEVLLFKKTDSVLRGPVAAELAAAADILGLSRVLLVPANPTLGRTIRDGIYRIDGVPLAETAFARDPHHPARSSRAVALLGDDANLPVTSVATNVAATPTGIVLGDATCTADLDTWSNRLGTGTLAAGGAEFFAACLRSRGCSRLPASAFPRPPSPVLMIAGTMVPRSRDDLSAAAAAGTKVLPMPDSLLTAAAPAEDALAAWTDAVASALHENGTAIVSASSIQATAAWTSEAIRRGLAELAARLHRRHAFRHLVVEGGATAAACAHALGWTELLALHAWAPGVVSLRAPLVSDVFFTLKPGSYPWPEDLWRQVALPRPSSTV